MSEEDNSTPPDARWAWLRWKYWLAKLRGEQGEAAGTDGPTLSATPPDAKAKGVNQGPLTSSQSGGQYRPGEEIPPK